MANLLQVVKPLLQLLHPYTQLALTLRGKTQLYQVINQLLLRADKLALRCRQYTTPNDITQLTAAGDILIKLPKRASSSVSRISECRQILPLTLLIQL